LSCRKLKNGLQVPELKRSVELIVKTKCPTKWKLVDLETGEEYVGTSPHENDMYWKKVKDA